VSIMFVDHPSWCDRAECTVTRSGQGTHAWPVARLEPDPVSGVRASVRMVEGVSVPGYPESGVVAVELMLAFPCFDPQVGDEDYFVLRGDRACALGRMLISAGRLANAPD
jgi:hypothetical protein